MIEELIPEVPRHLKARNQMHKMQRCTDCQGSFSLLATKEDTQEIKYTRCKDTQMAEVFSAELYAKGDHKYQSTKLSLKSK